MTGIGLLSSVIDGGVLAQANGDGGAAGLVGALICFGVLVAGIVASWKVYVKAGKPGWTSIIPIYNVIVLLEIVGRPIWWIILWLIPFVNFVIVVIVCIDLAKSFGKSAAFGIAILFFIGILILGFGSARYVGPAAAAN